MQSVNCCCNIIWLIIVGWELCLAWCLAEVFFCITIIGIPFGIQAFIIGCFVLWPFGKEIVDITSATLPCTCLCNIIWIITAGLYLGILAALNSIFFFISIIGIPFGMQLCKLAVLSFAPFGKEIVDEANLPKNTTQFIQPQPILHVQYGPIVPPSPQYIPPPQYIVPPTKGNIIYIPPNA